MMTLTLPVLSEASVTEQVKSFLEARGWRAVRNQRTVMPGHFQTGEPGMADFCFVYYKPTKRYPALSLTLWVEFKKKNSRMRCKCIENRGTRKRCTMCDQKNWRDRERARGALVFTGVDDCEWFIEQYETLFAWLHTGDAARGQLDLLAGLPT
jgi:hypothetical protein